MDGLRPDLRNIVIGVVAGACAAVVVTVLVVALLLLRRKYRDRKLVRRRRQAEARRRSRNTSSGDPYTVNGGEGSHTPPGTAYHSGSFSQMTNGASIELRGQRPVYQAYTQSAGAGRELPLPRGPTPLVDIPYRDSRLPSSRVQYTFDGRIHLPEQPPREAQISQYSAVMSQGEGRYPFHKRDSYEYGRYLPSAYGRVGSDAMSRASSAPLPDPTSSSLSHQGRYHGYDQWPDWSRKYSSGSANMRRSRGSDATSSFNCSDGTDGEESLSNIDSRPFRIPRARLTEPVPNNPVSTVSSGSYGTIDSSNTTENGKGNGNGNSDSHWYPQ